MIPRFAGVSTKIWCYFATLLFFPACLSAAANWTILGWTELGVNPMERGYSVFAIYPPAVTIHAQVIDSTGILVKSGSNVQVTYQALADASGSINSTSAKKTDFWNFSKALFSASGTVDTGIAGSTMPASGPQPMQFDATLNRFTATAVPITPYDDQWNINYYPLMQITARDTSGNVLATARVAIPVSNEVECRGCHASGANPAAQPLAGYAYDPDPNRDFKLNILSLHDSLNIRNPAYPGMLASFGYLSGGLLATAQANTQVRCDSCHSSKRSGSAGLTGALALTTAMHGYHAGLIDPKTNDTLDNSTDRSACYNCHPGTMTHGLRGAMSHSVSAAGTVQIQCQSCHGNLTALANPARRGYVDLPNCQACHTTTPPYRLTSALDSSGNLIQPSDSTFATSPNTLFNASTGHGGLQCSACHGAAHGEFQSSQTNENYQSTDLQGNAGVIGNCTACHKSGISSTNGGPHGLHTVGAQWVSQHTGSARNSSTCSPCHGTAFQGTVLSRSLTTQTLNTSFGNIGMFPGYQIGCYTCHSGPGGEGRSAAGLTLANISASATGGKLATIPVSGATGSTLRIVNQPLHGNAYIAGASVAYLPDSDFQGTDQFTFAAVNSANKDSNLATASVNVTATSQPSFTASAVTNAASYAAPVSPGMIALIQGQQLGPAMLQTFELNSGGFIEKAIGTVKVRFDGVAAPLLYASSGAVAAIVPYSVSGKTASNVSISYNGVSTPVIPVPVSAANPGVFSVDASGTGQAAALNQDGTLNSASNPAARGSIITLYLTGDGLESPQPPDGAINAAPYPATVLNAAVTIGGQPATILSAGAAPAAVAGLMQVNASIPANAPTGPVPVQISCGGVASQAGITIQVR
jgi:uncharacterized protein (TIGR03437 family)